MRKRSKFEIVQSKAIYEKHAARYKEMPDEQQDRRAKRMLAYTAALTKAIAVASRSYRAKLFMKSTQHATKKCQTSSKTAEQNEC